MLKLLKTMLVGAALVATAIPMTAVSAGETHTVAVPSHVVEIMRSQLLDAGYEVANANPSVVMDTYGKVTATAESSGFVRLKQVLATGENTHISIDGFDSDITKIVMSDPNAKVFLSHGTLVIFDAVESNPAETRDRISRNGFNISGEFELPLPKIIPPIEIIVSTANDQVIYLCDGILTVEEIDANWKMNSSCPS